MYQLETSKPSPRPPISIGMESANRMAAAPRRSLRKRSAFAMRPELIVADNAPGGVRCVKDLRPALRIRVLWAGVIMTLLHFSLFQLGSVALKSGTPTCAADIFVIIITTQYSN